MRLPKYSLSADRVRRLMRIHRVTIRELAKRLGVSQAIVRQAREKGVADTWTAIDWEQEIVGEYSAKLRAIVKQRRAAEAEAAEAFIARRSHAG